MIINTFRKAQAYNYILLAAFILLLRLAVLLNPSLYNSLIVYQPFVKLLVFFQFNFLSNPVYNILTTGAVIFIQAVLFGRIITRHNFFNKTTFLPELMYAVLCSMFTEFLTFSPIIFCNFFLLWILDKIFSFYRSQSTLQSAFDMGFIISLGSLLYFPFIFIFPIIWYSSVVFKSFSIREWFTGIIGLIVPYIILGTFYFWNDDFNDFYHLWLPFKFVLPQALAIEQDDYFALIPIIIVLLLSLNQVRVMFFKNVVQVRKSLQCLGFFVILIVASYFIMPDQHINHLMLAAAPVATFMTFYFNSAKVRWFYEFVFALLIISIFYFQLF
ncbi:hypothetical protein C3K47_01685 [Solitalea longa]|uniref:Beta-carotene 15,15'-monooxygenase n=1 Tax=Solitalea longa TaxID=2079460 RepID=A0A2S5A9G2_9SPHI|nr:DUF6427 family protein [Solitalea longa]POY39231.1 hypothetical protein C3K47_01685 [Solitalea longa]